MLSRTLTLACVLPVALATHYEDPKNGCGSDEQAIQVQGVDGDFCSPPCNGTVCPTDVPSASDAKPQCALKSPSGDQYCALLCTPGSNGACPTGATCQPISGKGLCTYPGAAPGPAPAPSPGKADQWTVLAGKFSAVTIGIAFRNDKVGWTTQTTGSDAPHTVVTKDGGASWGPVEYAPVSPIPMSITAKKGSGDAGLVGVTGFATAEYSLDGEHFNRSVFALALSQDIKYQNGLVTITNMNGPCVSTTNGVFYTCHKVPYKYKNGQIGRYSSAPSANVIYHAAGAWPHQAPPTPPHADSNENTVEVTSNLRLVKTKTENGVAVKYELGPKLQSHADPPPVLDYVAELWKSSDGGKTWKNLIAETGKYYFNDIHCFDETHCVAVAEGFAKDNSTEPGARVFVTTDGETFKEAHRETTDGASLMSAKMVSATEHWAGGATKVGAFTAPVLALHSKDGGQTYNNEHGGVLGQMITSMDFVSKDHGYATTVNALQISSLLQYGVAPATASMQLASDSIVV